jgi:hypothetical protein
VGACRQDTVVAEPDLADPVTRRWPVFSPAAVQAGISVTEALIRLRAFAFSHDRLLAAVAGDVAARGLRLR